MAEEEKKKKKLRILESSPGEKKKKVNRRKGLRKQKSKRKSLRKLGLCYICSDPEADATVGGMCQHIFCVPCFKNLVHFPLKNPTPKDNHLAAPTLGRCPECNSELYQFEMRKCKEGQVVKDKYAFKRNLNKKKWPINGRVYVPINQNVVLGSFCFDGEGLPYIDFRAAIENDKQMWTMNDGRPIPDKKYFEESCSYDEETRTFHGTIMWYPVTFQGSHQWDIVLGFKKGLGAIHVGVSHERKERIITFEVEEDISDEDVIRHHYPLDGVWQLSWENEQGEEESGKIIVRNNEFYQGPYLFNLNFRDPRKPGYKWPLDPINAEAKYGVDLIENPMGPQVGEKIVWETTHPTFAEITWTRESIGELPIQCTTHFGPGKNEYIEKITPPPSSEMEQLIISSSDQQDNGEGEQELFSSKNAENFSGDSLSLPLESQEKDQVESETESSGEIILKTR